MATAGAADDVLLWTLRSGRPVGRPRRYSPSLVPGAVAQPRRTDPGRRGRRGHRDRRRRHVAPPRDPPRDRDRPVAHASRQTAASSSAAAPRAGRDCGPPTPGGPPPASWPATPESRPGGPSAPTVACWRPAAPTAPPACSTWPPSGPSVRRCPALRTARSRRCSRPTARTCSLITDAGRALPLGHPPVLMGASRLRRSPAAGSPGPSGTMRCPSATTLPPASACKGGGRASACRAIRAKRRQKWLANVCVVVDAAHLRQLVRVALDPALELGDRDQDELPREHDLQLGLHLALEVVDADAERGGGLAARERVARNRRQRPCRSSRRQSSRPKPRSRRAIRSATRSAARSSRRASRARFSRSCSCGAHRARVPRSTRRAWLSSTRARRPRVDASGAAGRSACNPPMSPRRRWRDARARRSRQPALAGGSPRCSGAHAPAGVDGEHLAGARLQARGEPRDRIALARIAVGANSARASSGRALR